jgi:hypothetical protein
MKRGHLIKEEISVYFRMVLGRGVAGKETAPHGWEAENARYFGRSQRGKGAAPFPKKHGNDLKRLYHEIDKC